MRGHGRSFGLGGKIIHSFEQFGACLDLDPVLGHKFRNQTSTAKIKRKETFTQQRMEANTHTPPCSLHVVKQDLRRGVSPTRCTHTIGDLVEDVHLGGRHLDGANVFVTSGILGSVGYIIHRLFHMICRLSEDIRKLGHCRMLIGWICRITLIDRNVWESRALIGRLKILIVNGFRW